MKRKEQIAAVAAILMVLLLCAWYAGGRDTYGNLQATLEYRKEARQQKACEASKKPGTARGSWSRYGLRGDSSDKNDYSDKYGYCYWIKYEVAKAPSHERNGFLLDMPDIHPLYEPSTGETDRSPGHDDFTFESQDAAAEDCVRRENTIKGYFGDGRRGGDLTDTSAYNWYWERDNESVQLVCEYAPAGAAWKSTVTVRYSNKR